MPGTGNAAAGLPPALAVLALAAVAGCALPGGREAAERRIGAPPGLVAWVVAETLAMEFAPADPRPGHGGVPVFADGDALAVAASLGPDGRWHWLGDHRCAGGYLIAGRPALAPAAELPHRLPRGHSLAARFEVRPDGSGGSLLAGGLAAGGAHASAALADHLGRALARAEAWTLGQRDVARLAAAAQAPACCARHAPLQAGLLFALGRHHAAEGRLPSALARAREALAVMPGQAEVARSVAALRAAQAGVPPAPGGPARAAELRAEADALAAAGHPGEPRATRLLAELHGPDTAPRDVPPGPGLAAPAGERRPGRRESAAALRWRSPVSGRWPTAARAR